MIRLLPLGMVVACYTQVPLAPLNSCLALGFGPWAGPHPVALPPTRRERFPHFKLSPDRARWPRRAAWRQVRPLAYDEPVGALGWETLNMWLAPSPDSIVLFRRGQGTWWLYIEGAFHTDTMLGRAFLWPDRAPSQVSRAHAYAVRYDCSGFVAVGAASALEELLARGQRSQSRDPGEVVPWRAIRLSRM